jgi:hypothetical protein
VGVAESASLRECEARGMQAWVPWELAVAGAEGREWMSAAKDGNTEALQRLLQANVLLLLYRGQGTQHAFGGPACPAVPAMLTRRPSQSCKHHTHAVQPHGSMWR